MSHPQEAEEGCARRPLRSENCFRPNPLALACACLHEAHHRHPLLPPRGPGPPDDRGARGTGGAEGEPVHRPLNGTQKYFRGVQLCVLVALLSLASSALVAALLPERVPRNHDEFAYLLAAQTFAGFRLTNPTPPRFPFFESPHVLLEPSYMAKYPPGHGLALAVGLRLGRPIYGVWLESALFAAAVTWMLRAFFAARWALLGGVVVILQFGLTHYWAQTYWGGRSRRVAARSSSARRGASGRGPPRVPPPCWHWARLSCC